MPIRINLLAEQQAAEEMRRRDPVKRSMYAGGIIVVLVLLWSGWVQLDVISEGNELANQTNRWNAVVSRYNQVTNNRALTAEIERKLGQLYRLGTNRFLWGHPLDSLQKTQLQELYVTRIAGIQTHVYNPEKSTVVDNKRVITPGSVTEKVVLRIEARDYGRTSDQNMLRFREVIERNSYFRNTLATNGIALGNVSEPQIDLEAKKTYVSFTLDCRYPEQTRR